MYLAIKPFVHEHIFPDQCAAERMQEDNMLNYSGALYWGRKSDIEKNNKVLFK